MKATPDLIDLGTNWRTAEGYTNHEKDARKWAWEFLRRNVEYQRDWLEAVDLADSIRSEVTLEEFSQFCTVEPLNQYESVRWMLLWGSHHQNDRARSLIARAYEWHLVSPADPRTQDPIWNIRSPSIFVFVDDDEGSVLPVAPARSIYGSEVSMTFDLTRPIPPQVRGIRGFLERAQETLNASGKIDVTNQKRVLDKKYILYLRVLDARRERATIAKMAEMISDKNNNSYPEYQSDKDIHNWLKAAERLRDGGYRDLLFC